MFRDQGDERPYSPFTYPVVPPDADPLGGILVKLAINQEWLACVRGACLSMIDVGTWNTDDPDVMELTIRRAYDLLTVLTEAAVEPPFYDSDEDASDETLPNQPWYEAVSDWVITAFLATTFTPGAAIVYRTTIPKLRLAFRTGNLGAIVRVLLNDIEVWTGSTHSPAVGQLVRNVDAQGFATLHGLGPGPWALKIVNEGAPESLRAIQGLDATAKLEVELGDIRPTSADMQFRQTDCGLETSTDGETWVSIYDPTNCIQGIVNTTVGTLIDDGAISQGGTSQPGPSPAPDPGLCRTHHVKLSASDIWLCPSPVNSGDTVHVINAKGGWNDGGPSNPWRCPNGEVFAEGACGGSTVIGDDDPINTLPHMMLIGHILNTFFDPTTTYTVPAVTVDQPFYLQANDSLLADNPGGIEFDVEVCSAAAYSGWYHKWDYRNGVPSFQTLTQGTQGSTGIAEWYSGGYRQLGLTIPFLRAGTIDRAVVTIRGFSPYYTGADMLSWWFATGGGLMDHSGANESGDWIIDTGTNWAKHSTGAVNTFFRILTGWPQGHNSGDATVESIEVWGDYPDPF